MEMSTVSLRVGLVVVFRPQKLHKYLQIITCREYYQNIIKTVFCVKLHMNHHEGLRETLIISL